ncbi:MAG: glucose-1-phosphate adenylyltransferase [Candidatus Izimaplasma sp.]|nr:glucose-1-phosphate adenylyltransferase [Candidatus Izimaplasma bacterium]
MKKIISMILVGGKGTRLGDITNDKAKPAVSYGGKYRLIDFTLSNLSNSNIDVCGIITQYEPQELINYIGNGSSWDLDYVDGGIRFLTPFLKKDNVLWQKGTGHAVKQFFDFIKNYQAEYVLILPGDHIYKMDYLPMLKEMEKVNSDITIASKKLSEDINRFGIIETDENNFVKSFKEKPNNPTSNLVSMGIYIFKTKVLEELLFTQEDMYDFGNDIIPQALKNNKKILNYEFKSYWRDVGTIESLYNANMDLLNDNNFLELNSSKNLPVFSRSLNLEPHVILNNGDAKNCVIADGCQIDGEINHSVIAYKVIVKKGSSIKDSCILSNVIINENVKLEKTIVNENVILPKNYVSENEKITLITENNLYEVGEINE